MDVKYVPMACFAGKEKRQFYQYTIIEEASRKRFIYVYEENSSYSTIDFVKRAILFFGHTPKIIQQIAAQNLHISLKPNVRIPLTCSVPTTRSSTNSLVHARLGTTARWKEALATIKSVSITSFRSTLLMISKSKCAAIYAVPITFPLP